MLRALFLSTSCTTAQVVRDNACRLLLQLRTSESVCGVHRLCGRFFSHGGHVTSTSPATSGDIASVLSISSVTQCWSWAPKTRWNYLKDLINPVHAVCVMARRRCRRQIVSHGIVSVSQGHNAIKRCRENPEQACCGAAVAVEEEGTCHKHTQLACYWLQWQMSAVASSEQSNRISITDKLHAKSTPLPRSVQDANEYRM